MIGIFKKISCLILYLCFAVSGLAQTAAPTVSFYSKDSGEEIIMSDGDSQTAQAPCEIKCVANLDYDSSEFDKVVCEWKIFNSDEGEEKPFVDRFEENINYTLTESGGYGIKLYVTFINNSTGMTNDYVTETGFKIVISESKLICTDFLSPNDDNINDKLVITCQSLVKVDGAVLNRWGKVLHRFNVNNIAEGWDGKVNGKPVKDGAYILHIDAVGSDGLHYKIKKVINVLKGFNESADSNPEG